MGKRIKNGFILFLCMAVLMTAMPVIRVDAADTMEEPVLDAGIYISSTTVSTGSYGYLSVQAENFADVSGMEFSIYYDASIMTNISCWSGWLVSETTMDINTQTPGEIKCSFLSLDGIDGGGELLSLNFYVPENAAIGTYPLRLAVGEVYDTGLTPIQMVKRSGNVSVMKGEPTVSSVYFYPNMYESEVKCGETFTYRLMAGTSYGLSGGNFEFEYDKDLLTLEDVSLGSALQTSTSLSAVNTENDGYVKITYADIDAISEEYGTEYFILTFRAKEDVSGHTQIRFSANGLTSVDLNKLMTSTLETQIYVKNPEQMPDTATLRFEVDKENSTRRNLKVNVILEGKAGVAAGDFTIQYDSGLMQCVAATESEAITNADGAYLMTKETISDGYIYFSYVNTKPFTKSQTIMILDFQIREWNSGTANLYISGRGVVDIDFKALPVEYETLSVYVDGNPIDVNNVNFWVEEGTYVYNGSNHYPKVLNDSGLVEGVDYWLGYDENYNAGCGYVWIYGMGEYTGSTCVCFEILKGNIENLDIRLSYTSTTYNGEYKYPEVLTDGLMPGWDFQTNYYDNLYAGTAKVVIEGINNYEGQKILTFEILPSAQNSIEMYSFWLDQSSYVYDGMPKYPAVYNNHALTEGVDYQVSYVNNVDVGMGMVEIRGIGQYTGSVTLYFNINSADANMDISQYMFWLDKNEETYNGSMICPRVNHNTMLMEGVDYSVTYDQNVNVGRAAVTVTGIGMYTGQATLYFDILPADISSKKVTLSYYSTIYDGIEKRPVVQVDNLMEGYDYTVTYSNNVYVGTATVTVTGINNYQGQNSETFVIVDPSAGMSKDIADYEFKLDGYTFTYNGSEIYPGVMNAGGLIENRDYRLYYSQNIQAGWGYVTAEGMGEYYGKVDMMFEIKPADLGVRFITLSQYSYTYDGMEKRPMVTIDGLMEGIDYTVSYWNNIEVGTATVEVQGIGNYQGYYSTTFEIVQGQKPTEDIFKYSFWFETDSYVYDGSGKYPKICNNDGLVEGIDFKVTYYQNVNAGWPYVTIEGIGNYSGTLEIMFQILPANLSDRTIILSADNFFYNGMEHCPMAWIDGLIQGQDYTVTYSNNIEIGTATVEVQGIGNYEGTLTKTFEIQAAQPEGSKDVAKYVFELECSSYVYDGVEKRPIVYSKDGLLEGIDYTVTYHQNVNAGWPYVTVEGIGDYYGKFDLMFEIRSVDISEKNMYIEYESTIYDGMEKRPSVWSDGMINGIDFVVSYVNNIDVGTAMVEIRGIGNYQGYRTMYFEIVEEEKEAIDITAYRFWLESIEYTYDGSVKRPRVCNDAMLVEGKDYRVSYSKNIDAGWSNVTIEGIGNYFGTLDLMFEIKPASIGAKEIALEYEITTYDGTEKCPAVFVKGLEMGKDFKVTYSNNVNVGTATVTIEGIGNYQGTRVFMFKIEEASTPGPDEPEKPEGLPFVDVSEGKWFYNSVKWAYENGLLTGTSETTFDPNGQMTRGMLVTVLYRKEGRPAVEETSKFPDVNPKKYYAPAIIWASANKLVSGYTNGNFGPEDSITREQIAKILYLYADYKGFDTSNFTDISSYKDAAKVSGYAKKYMEWAVAEGLIKGSNGELNPKGNATRAEISAILKRFVEKYEVTAY